MCLGFRFFGLFLCKQVLLLFGGGVGVYLPFSFFLILDLCSDPSSCSSFVLLRILSFLHEHCATMQLLEINFTYMCVFCRISFGRL